MSQRLTEKRLGKLFGSLHRTLLGTLLGTLLRTLLGYAAATGVGAHELPTESLQIGSQYTVVTSFNLSASTIEQSYAEASGYFNVEQWLTHRKVQYQVPADEVSYYCGKAELPRVKTCGHIDPFYRAGVAAIVHCQAYALLHGYTTLIPRITGPASYVSSSAQATADHHAGYDTAHGLSFLCVHPIRQLQVR